VIFLDGVACQIFTTPTVSAPLLVVISAFADFFQPLPRFARFTAGRLRAVKE
jgi:hypothetical protein